jgi:flagellar assembly factor FliW
MVDVPDDEVVTFTDGLPGFLGKRRMVLLGGGEFPGGAAGDGHHSLFWLQDVTDPDLAFLTIVPWSAYPDYDIEIEADTIGSPPSDDLCVLVIVTVRRDDNSVRLTSNLLAPIVIDATSRVGRQVILQNQDWPVQAPLSSASSSTVATEAT